MNPENEPIFELMTDADLREWDKIRCFKCGEIVNIEEAKKDDFDDLMCPECFEQHGEELYHVCPLCGCECEDSTCYSCKMFNYMFDDMETGNQVI